MKYITILLDDDPISSFLLGKMLERLEIGSPQRTFQRGEELLEWLESSFSDFHKGILFLDIMMPVMDGWEVLRKLEEGGYFEKLLVVMVSSSISPIDRERAL